MPCILPGISFITLFTYLTEVAGPTCPLVESKVFTVRII